VNCDFTRTALHAIWMENSTPPAPRNLSATSRAAANAPLRSDPRNRCARLLQRSGLYESAPLPFARKFRPVSMLLPLLPLPFEFPSGAGSPSRPPFWLSLRGLVCLAPAGQG